MAKKVAVKKPVKHDPKWILLAGRVLVAMLFVVSGWEKLSDIKATAAFMATTGMPLATTWMAGLAGLVELLGGLALLVGWKARQAAGILAGFLVLVTYFIHLVPAWNMAAGMARTTEMMHVRLNLALLGGLLAMYVAGPGGISRDRK